MAAAPSERSDVMNANKRLDMNEPPKPANGFEARLAANAPAGNGERDEAPLPEWLVCCVDRSRLISLFLIAR
jgi:hypothetical protein